MQPAIIQPNGRAPPSAAESGHHGVPPLTSMSSVFDYRPVAAETRRSSHLALATGLLLCCAPLLVLTVPRWANVVLFLGGLLALLQLARGELPRASLAPRERRWALAVMLAYVAPVASAALAGVLRQDVNVSEFDAPSRFLLAIPIFLFVLRTRWPVARVLAWVLPLALAIVLGYLQLWGYDHKWEEVGGPRRLTTFLVDPLVFGYFNLTFGLMALVWIRPGDWRDGRGRWGIAAGVIALALGAYFSVRSGSRSGWLALPLVIGIWAHYHWGRRHRLAAVAVLATVLLLPVAAYFLVPVVGSRVDEAVQDVVQYPWHGVLMHETSLGYRITFMRMAADLFASHPWAGIGDFSHMPPPVGAFSYASPAAIEFGFRSGFHNQVVTTAVRSGVGGALATLALLLVPLLVCARGLRAGAAPAARRDAMMGLAYCICVVVTSLGMEVVDLKFAASFYAVMTALFCGAVLGRRGADEG